jgi:hypothetical protein
MIIVDYRTEHVCYEYALLGTTVKYRIFCENLGYVQHDHVIRVMFT